MIHVQLGNLTIRADTMSDLERALGHMGMPLSEKEMADLAGVDARTIRRWKCNPAFPRTDTGIITRRDFFAFLFRTNQDKTGQ